MEYDYASPEHRLHDAAARWYPEVRVAGIEDVVDAAVQCLVDGLDSPHVRILAGAHPSDGSEQIKALLDAALDELNIPLPSQLSPWKQAVADGRSISRTATDRIRFAIREADPTVGGHELLVYVNDVEMTRRGAGMGMDPFEVLIPDNKLVAAAEPRQVPIARCGCGTYGCGLTDVTVVRDGDVVLWEWLYESPMDHGVTFRADQYDAETARIAADRSWERPPDTVARLVLTHADRGYLAERGLTISWAAQDHADRALFKVALFTGNDEYHSAEAGYQVFLRFTQGDRSPAHVAAEVIDVLQRPPGKWRATWHAIKPGITQPPAMASRRWRRERFD